MSVRKLADLDPSLWSDKETGAEGVMFDCPACDGNHSILVPWKGPSPFPSGALWTLVDPNMDTLTLSPSIDLTRVSPETEKWLASLSPEDRERAERTRCTFHGFVQQGEVRW